MFRIGTPYLVHFTGGRNMKGNSCSATTVRSRISLLFLVLGMVILFSSTALAFTVSLNVQGKPKVGNGTSAIGNYRWLIEEDTTHPVTLNTPDRDLARLFASQGPCAGGGLRDPSQCSEHQPARREAVFRLGRAGLRLHSRRRTDRQSGIRYGHLQRAPAAHGADHRARLPRQQPHQQRAGAGRARAARLQGAAERRRRALRDVGRAA